MRVTGVTSPGTAYVTRLHSATPLGDAMDGSMRDDQYRFLSIHRQIPARRNVEQVGWVLNFQPHDIPALVAARLLKPLGNPPANGSKYFSADDILEYAKDRNWLAKASAAITQHWRRKNASRNQSSPAVADNLTA